MENKYLQLEESINQSKTLEDIQINRVLIFNYQRVSGNNENSIKQVRMLSNLLNVKEKEILKAFR